MRTVGMGVNQNKEDDNNELKEAFEGLTAENEKLHARIGELEATIEVLKAELKAATKVKENEDPESKSKK